MWCRCSPSARTRCSTRWRTPEEPGCAGLRSGCSASWGSPCLSSMPGAFSSTPLVSCLTEDPSPPWVSGDQSQSDHSSVESVPAADNGCKVVEREKKTNVSYTIFAHVFLNQLLVLAETADVPQLEGDSLNVNTFRQRAGFAKIQAEAITQTHTCTGWQI